MTIQNHTAWIDFNQRVPMRDGVTLSADVYRPKDDARYPVILLRTPYQKTGESQLSLGRYFAERGYALVYMDVRGRGDSDGAFVPYRNEGRDGYDAIEWCAAQPWSDGNISTMGGSYLGRIQWLAALEHPPHLRAMIVAVTPSDPFVESPTGVPMPSHICWLHLVSGRINQNMEAVDWMQVYTHLPLATMDQAAGRVSQQWRDETQHEEGIDDYWRAIMYQDKFDQLDLPVMHISGWYDDEQVGTPLNFARMTTQSPTPAGRASQHLLMGPWGHAINTSQKLDEVDFGPDSLIDLRGYQLRWLNHWLKGEQNGVDQAPQVHMFVMGENRWRDEHEWPLARTAWTRYYLHSAGSANSRFGDGALSTTPPAAEPTDGYRYDPARPTPYITEATSSQIGGADDYAAVQRRDDMLVYVTPPLAQDTEVSGPITVELYAASSVPDTDFTAMLLDIHPTGLAQRLCDGIVRARFREGMENPSLITPGQVYRYEIDCWNTAQVFKQGHRICLQIASCAFPKYDRNLNTGESLATSTRMAVAEQQIYHTADYPSCVLLPIIPGVQS